MAYLDLTVEADTVRVEARLHGDDLGAPVGRSPLERPTREVASARAEAVTRYVAARVALSLDAHPCPLASVQGASVQPAQDGSYRLAVRYTARCPRVIDELDVRDDLFFDIDDNHRAFARAQAFGATFEKVFGVYDRRWRVQGSPSTFDVVRQYARLGVEHIVTGYDHLAFLLALLAALAARGTRAGLRPALAVVTSFTVAHSVTLALAALGVVRPSSRIVESTIALSIALVAAIDLVRVRRASSAYSESAPLRAGLGFGFGLVHGLGFAGAIGELGLPRRALVRSLAAFNLGVELGQLALALVAFPALGWLATRSREPRAYRQRVLAPISLALVALGLYWFVRRAFGLG
ncbi:MAG: HupE/UreJ family protein [Myxococcales bacterium]|nr:HupE/UreJ family protein [Myxococcales bacterium]